MCWADAFELEVKSHFSLEKGGLCAVGMNIGVVSALLFSGPVWREHAIGQANARTVDPWMMAVLLYLGSGLGLESFSFHPASSKCHP
jgi:hypothetical protein